MLALKNGGDELAGPFASYLWQGAQNAGFPENATVTFVPMHPFRRLLRGYNQAELLARELARLASWPRKNLLRRVAWGSQKGQGRKSRQERVAQAFRPRAKVPERVLLVDDVVTTGATAAACTRTLRHGGAQEVWVLAVAKSLKR